MRNPAFTSLINALAKRVSVAYHRYQLTVDIELDVFEITRGTAPSLPLLQKEREKAEERVKQIEAAYRKALTLY